MVIGSITRLEQNASALGVRHRLRNDLPLVLLALLFLVMPLYRSGFLEDSFNAPKLGIIQLILLALWPALLLSQNDGTAVKRRNPVSLLLGGLVCVHGISIIYARSTPLALNSIVYWSTFGLLHLACLFAIRDGTAVRVILSCGVISATITAAWTILEDGARRWGLSFMSPIVARLPDWRGHLSAGLGNSGHIAGFIGLFLPAAIIFFLEAQRVRLLLLLSIFLMFGGLVVTWSIGSSGSTVIALLLWCGFTVWLGPRRLLQWKRLWLVLAAGAVATAFYFLPHPLNPHSPSLFTEAFGSERWKEGGATRVVIWKTTWQMIEQNWQLGVGAGNFTFDYVQQLVPSVVMDPHLAMYAGGYTNEAHNEYLHVWSETGISGLIIYLAMILTFFVRLRRTLRGLEPQDQLAVIASAAGATVFLLDSLMTFPIRLPAHFAGFMFFLAVPEGLRQSSMSTTRKKRTSLLVMATAATLVLFVLHGRHLMAEFYLKRGRTAAELADQPGLPGKWFIAEKTLAQLQQSTIEGRLREAETLRQQNGIFTQHPDMRKAEDDFRQALKWDPHYSNASSRLGSLLLMRGSYGESRDVLKQTLETLESYEIHDRYAWASYFMGDRSTAADHWQLCAKRRSPLADNFNMLVEMARK